MIEMMKCPHCGKELQEGEVCTCQINQTVGSQTTDEQVTGTRELNDTHKTENISENSKGENVKQALNAKGKENKKDIASTFNNAINMSIRYCYLTIKFAWAFLKNPFVFISKVIQNNDYKVGILFAVITSLFISLQNLLLSLRGVKFVEDILGISRLLPSGASFKTFVYNFIIILLLYLLYCAVIKLAFMIIKENLEFKSILGSIGVNLIPVIWMSVLNIILQFITVWLVILVSIFGVIVNTVLNFWSVKTLSKDKNTLALYINATAYVVCIIIVAIVIFGFAYSITGSTGGSFIDFGSQNAIIGTWSDDKDTITFNPDGTFKAYYYWIGGAWEINGNRLYLTGALTGKEGYYFRIEGNKLILDPVPGSGRSRYEFYRVNK